MYLQYEYVHLVPDTPGARYVVPGTYERAFRPFSSHLYLRTAAAAVVVVVVVGGVVVASPQNTMQSVIAGQAPITKLWSGRIPR